MRTEQDVLNVFSGKTVVALQVIRLEEVGELLGDKVLVGTTDKKVYNDLCTVLEYFGMEPILHPMLKKAGNGLIYKIVSIYSKVDNELITAECDQLDTMSKLVDVREIISCYQEFLDYQEELKRPKVEVKDMSIEDQRKAADKLSRASELLEEVIGEQRDYKIHLLLEKDNKCYPMDPLTALNQGYIQGDSNIDRSIWWSIDGTILMFVRGVGSFVIELSKTSYDK